jgi:hypothetical protein
LEIVSLKWIAMGVDTKRKRQFIITKFKQKPIDKIDKSMNAEKKH